MWTLWVRGAEMCEFCVEQNRLTMFVIQIGDFNPAFEQFLKFINGIKYRGESKGVNFFL